MSLRIYEEQKAYLHETRPYNYLPDDIVYRLPWNMGEPEPPLRVLYPLILKTRDGREVIDPLTIYIGRTAGKKPFAYNPRYVVNPLILVVGTPGAGKSIPEGEKVIILRNGEIIETPIEEVKPGDKALTLINVEEAEFRPVTDVMVFHHAGKIIKIKLESGRVVRATPDHSFTVLRNGKLEAILGSYLKKGDKIPVLTPKQLEILKYGNVKDGDMFAVTYEKIVDIEEETYEGLVYDIEVAGESLELSTFMLANGVFVHNSATLKTFIYNLLQNDVFAEGRVPPVVVVDPEGEYAVIGKMIGQENMLHLKLGRRDYINIFDRPTKSINPFSWYMRMLAVIQKFLAISPAQAAQAYRVLKRAIFEVAKDKGITFDPATWIKPDITLEEVYNWIMNQVESLEKKKKMTPGERMFYRGANTLITRMDQWMYPPNDAFTKRSTVDLSRIFDYKLVVLDARGLAKDLFGVFTYWIVYWAYGLMLERGPLPEFGIRMVLVIDEAWALLKKSEKKDEENPLEALARRGRKYGIMILVATQTPEDVDEKMFSLFGTLVSGIIPSDKMVNKIVESRGMPKRFKSIIKSLGRGWLVWSINWAKKDFPMSRVPIIVNTDYPVKRVVHISQE